MTGLTKVAGSRLVREREFIRAPSKRRRCGSGSDIATRREHTAGAILSGRLRRAQPGACRCNTSFPHVHKLYLVFLFPHLHLPSSSHPSFIRQRHLELASGCPHLNVSTTTTTTASHQTDPHRNGPFLSSSSPPLNAVPQLQPLDRDCSLEPPSTASYTDSHTGPSSPSFHHDDTAHDPRQHGVPPPGAERRTGPSCEGRPDAEPPPRRPPAPRPRAVSYQRRRDELPPCAELACSQDEEQRPARITHLHPCAACRGTGHRDSPHRHAGQVSHSATVSHTSSLPELVVCDEVPDLYRESCRA